jgi:predicted short-subunit dehydrogenase-like oxidoreductase (DUF2520 family)
MLGKLNIIGCGVVGKTLGALWNESSVFTIQDICNQSEASGSAAVGFIGAGKVVASLDSASAADVIAITVSDDAIENVASRLIYSGAITPGAIIFHCSGALSSEILSDLRACGAKVASAHPVKSFSDLEQSRRSFPGTKVAIEGDDQAVELLSRAFGAIGGVVFRIDPSAKGFYHTGLVFACNYLTALMECAVETCGKAGLNRTDSLALMQPLVRETIEAIFARGTESALTGPVARGEAQVVSKQLELLREWNGELASLYSGLGRIALDIAERKETANAERLAKLREII